MASHFDSQKEVADIKKFTREAHAETIGELEEDLK